MRIGIFDSGIGGLTVLKRILNVYSNTEYLYYADTKNLPYGGKTQEELIEIGKNIISFFENNGVDTIVIACGTCSSLVDEYRKITNIPIFDVITPTVQYVKDKYKSVALLATEATIENGTFQKELENEGIKVKTIACPSFVPYIEGLSKVEPDYSPLLNLREEGIDGIILGCTHYPYLSEIIEDISGLPTIDMGKCITKLIEVDNSNNKSVTVYVSKTTPGLEEIIESIIEFDVDIVNLDNKLKKTI